MTKPVRETPLFTASFVAIVGVLALATGASGLYVPGAWYQELAKPDWAPPAWVFAPVWFALYIIIAVAQRLVWRASAAPSARLAWITQIVLVGLWSILFFGLHRVDLALVDAVVLWVAIAAFIGLAWSSARPAALLFVPYLAWVSFAVAVNLAIYAMNS